MDERIVRRAHRRAPRPAAPVSSTRADAVRGATEELESWLARAIPDRSAPLDADDIARLVRDCLQSCALDDAAAADFTVNTVHYYRRKDILDAPEGRTSAARYGVRHLWQAIAARLAGQLGLLTLAEARVAMRGESEQRLADFVAERIADARARQAVRRAPASATDTGAARPLRATPRPHPRGVSAVVIPLPGDAWCVVPSTHPAHESAAAARALVQALANALPAATPLVVES